MKFIHAADIHLDSPLRGLQPYDGVSVDRIRAATRQALLNLVDFAVSQRVDLLLIAGDLYDGDWKDHHTGLFLASQLIRLRDAGVRTYMISGNHDAANRMTRTLRLPLNVDGTSCMLPHDQLATVVLEDLNVALHGRGFAKAAEYDNLVDDYPAAVPHLLNIGLLHTSLAGAEGHEPYAPCRVEQLLAKGYQYWALGHVHQRAIHPAERQPTDGWIVFPGNLQGRHIREVGPKGCMLVEAEGNRITSVNFQPLDVVRWQLLRIELQEDDDAASLEKNVRRHLQQAVEAAADRMVAIRIILSGAAALHDTLAAHRNQWTNQVRCWGLEVGGGNLWIERLQLRTTKLTQSQPLTMDDGPLGEISAYIAELKSDPRALAAVMGQFSSLRRKLPDELCASEEMSKLFRVDGLQDILEEVEPLLLGQLKETAE